MMRAAVGLGSNLDSPIDQVRRGLESLRSIPRSRLTSISSLYYTEPTGFADQPWFVNAAALLETDLPPLQLLGHLLRIETERKRTRPFPNAPRTLDLDLLLYDAIRMNEDRLTLPHPRLPERRFVLTPLCEIAPDWIHPERQCPVRDLLERCLDPHEVRKIPPEESHPLPTGSPRPF